MGFHAASRSWRNFLSLHAPCLLFLPCDRSPDHSFFSLTLPLKNSDFNCSYNAGLHCRINPLTGSGAPSLSLAYCVPSSPTLVSTQKPIRLFFDCSRHLRSRISKIVDTISSRKLSSRCSSYSPPSICDASGGTDTKLHNNSFYRGCRRRKKTCPLPATRNR